MLNQAKINEMYDKYLANNVDFETLYKLVESIDMTHNSYWSLLFYNKMSNFDEIAEDFTPLSIAKYIQKSNKFNINDDYFKLDLNGLISMTEKEYQEMLRHYEKTIITEYLKLLDEYNTENNFYMEVVDTFNLDAFVPYDLIDYYLS